MKKLSYTVSSFILALASLAAKPAAAICPVCVVAVGAGLGLSEYLGIDNTIAGVWIGGLMVSLIVWTINWFNKKNWAAGETSWLTVKNGSFGKRDLRDITIVILYYGLTFWPLWAKNLIGHPYNRLFGIDKLILGATIGSLGFLAATTWYDNIKKRHGHAHFPFEKVVLPVGALIILSFIFYFLTR
jgi:hypothetical protein